MKILHTSDWHIGQKLLNKDRLEEHEMALEWLQKTIIQQSIDVLVVAGDIFDIGSPPNYARKLYYAFLTSLINSCCRHIVIIGGNHDSPSMLEAPKPLLESLNTYVLGAAPTRHKDAILQLPGSDGKTELLIAAVPFLRDRDLRRSTSGETGAQRIEAIKHNIREHYLELGEMIKENPLHKDVPVLATGHLYASGAQSSEKQNNIYIGDVENIQARDFPAVFDYVALGHIHRAQSIGKLDHVRYSGSIIPLSFSETKDQKSIYILDFQGKSLESIQSVEIPTFRRLKSITGNLNNIQEKLEAFAKRRSEPLAAWVEVLIESDQVLPNINQEITEACAKLGLEALKVRVLSTKKGIWNASNMLDLEDLDILEVFRKKCNQFGQAPNQIEELESSFLELQDWMREMKQAAE